MIFNNETRTPLDNVYITPKFKTVFPDFATWQATLLKYGIKNEDIELSDFQLIETMIGNSNLKWRTDEKNKGFLGLLFKNELFKYRKNLQLSNISVNDLINEKTVSKQTLYTIDRDLHGEASADYTDNSVINEISSNKTPADYYNILKAHTQINDPKLVFLTNIASQIVLPLQHIQTNQRGQI